MIYQNTLEAFRAAMAEAGIVTNEAIIADGHLHRAHVEGDRRGTRNGAYILHTDGKAAGWAMHYKTGATVRWSASGKREPMSLAMRQQIEAERIKRQIETDERHRDAADKAKFIWHRAKPISHQSEHPYLIAKRIQPHGLRLSRGALVVPIYSEGRELVSLQFIDTDGGKMLLSGGRKKGCFSPIGDFQNITKLLITEGYATGASLHESLNLPVLVAIDAGNLTPVAEAARRLFPDAEIIVMGDNDESGKGQAAARKSALACGGRYLIPEVPGQDWNDVLTNESREASNG